MLIYVSFGVHEAQSGQMDHLGLATWQKLGIYIGPPFLIALIFMWGAVYKATTHPDQKLLKKEARERQRNHRR